MHRFFTLDVFTQQPLAGNPLAVVLEADDLDTAAMQAIAREFGLPETVFLLKPAEEHHNARARIFTPARELPFAGHPSVGAAVLLASLKFGESEDAEEGERDAMVVLEEEIGLVRAGVKLRPGAAPFAVFDVPKPPKEEGSPPSADNLAHGIGLVPSDIGLDNHKPVRASAGVPYVFVPVRSREALARCQSNRIFWETIVGEEDHGAVYVYCRDTEDEAHAFRARMFSPGLGIDEDPATGSAVAAFACVVARFEPLGDGTHTLIIEQGYERGRPSQIMLEVEL
ncbi:MAG TPA: PhzF family phenazine biosynthesis protein, partial [Hyphomicrobiales bacterium]|nr:PhzF family phenazine biosynthesis protein [Hyphomicrobiales bacterium]